MKIKYRIILGIILSITIIVSEIMIIKAGNFRDIWRFVIVLGFWCNFLAISFNGWKMPVFKFDDNINANDKYHKEFSDFKKVKFAQFCDIYLLRFTNKVLIFSIGDFIMVLGLLGGLI
jgi:hypothetical protein